MQDTIRKYLFDIIGGHKRSIVLLENLVELVDNPVNNIQTNTLVKDFSKDLMKWATRDTP